MSMKEPSFVGPAWVGLILVGIGLIATSATFWEGVIWTVVTLLGIIQAVRFWRMRAAARKDVND